MVRRHPRRRAAKYHGRARDAAERQRGVDRVIAGVALLLVRRLLLLIDHDEAGALERREERGAGADDDVGRAIEDPAPFVEPLARRERAVQQRDTVAEASEEARHDLRGEHDLGDEDDDAFAARERGGCRAQIHLRLPAAGHAMEQEPETCIAARAPRQRRRNRGERRGLRGRRRRLARTVRVGEGELHWDPPDGPAPHRHKPSPCERSGRLDRRARLEQVPRAHRAGSEGAQRKPLARAEPHVAAQRLLPARREREDRLAPLAARGAQRGGASA